MLKKVQEKFEELKSLPEKKLKVIAVSVSGVLTFIIVSSSIVLPSDALRASEARVSSEAAAVKSVASPFSMMKQETANTFSKIVDNPAIDELKNLSKIFTEGVLKKKTQEIPEEPSSSVVSQEDFLADTSTSTTEASSTPISQKKI